MPMVFLSYSYPVEFFGDHSKVKFAKDLPNVICTYVINLIIRSPKERLNKPYKI